MKNGRSRVQNDGPDRIYYNISIPHNDALSINGSPTPADFFEVRSNALFSGDPKDYSMSIVRFTIPTGYIPLHFFPVIPNPGNPADPNYGLNTVTLSYNGTDFQTHVIFKPQNTFVPIPPAPTPGIPQNKQYIDYYSIYSVEWEVDLFNTAFQTSFNDLKTAFPGAPVTQPPYLKYDPTTKLFSLVAQKEYNTNQALPYVQIFMNQFSYELFETSFEVLNNGWGSNITNGKNIQFIVNNKGDNSISNAIPPSLDYPATWDSTVNYVAANNTIVSWNGLFWIVVVNNTNSEPSPTNANWALYQGFDAYVMTQDYSTIPQFPPFTNITFLSASLPFRAEWVSGGNTQQQIAGTEGVSSQLFRPILTDFEIDLTTGFETRSFLHYVPTAEYRRIDLLGNTPIRTIDIRVYWKDNYDNLFPIMIPAHQEVSIKILFERKKSKYKTIA